MSVWEGLGLGLRCMSDPMVPIMLLLGSLIGTLVGALPGLGPTSGCALLLPVAYRMATAEQGMALLVSIYLGCMFGGRITSILINVPGDAPAVVTTFDGYPMMKQGRGGVALGISALSSFVSGFISFILLAGFAPSLARVALRFGPAEYFSVMLFGFAAVVGLAEKQYLRSLITLSLGILISTVGADLLTGTRRFVFVFEMYEGINFSVIALGLFGLAEVLVTAEKIPEYIKLKEAGKTLSLRSMLPTQQDLKSCTLPVMRGTAIGTAIGFLPGAGGTIATFISYSTEKTLSKEPGMFGRGKIEGVAAPEAANNASVGGAMIPMLSLGVPGSATTAILMGAMIMFGLKPGPRVFETSPTVAWTMIVSLFIANFMLLAANTLLIPLFIKLIDVGQHYLKPIICATVMVGVFAITYGTFSLFLCVGFGMLGYFFKKLKYPSGPFLLALVLFENMEESFRQAVLISRGSYMTFFTRPLSLAFMLLSMLSLLYPLIKSKLAQYRAVRRHAKETEV